ncbi:hypothetical protein GE09DRAFT_502708 [Coniochaeta sp. 2T2.1]|nr:hypothetical protein GE09DRAFT_502708 [Coniochaeta sp. 2T2.1]
MPVCIIKAAPTAEELAAAAAVEATAEAAARKKRMKMKKDGMNASSSRRVQVQVQRVVTSVARAVEVGGSRKWTAREDRVLIAAWKEGLTFGAIGARYIPAKSASACQKRYQRLMKPETVSSSASGGLTAQRPLPSLEVEVEETDVQIAEVRQVPFESS